MFDLDSLARVQSITDIQVLPRDTQGLFVYELTDEKLETIAVRLSELRHLIADGNTRVTDAALVHLRTFARLESLDLEWSSVTDEGLRQIADVRSLRWVDLGFCASVTNEGVAELRRVRPDLKVEWPGF